MADHRPEGVFRSRWPGWIGRTIDMICLAVLLLVVGTVIYGFWLRATWAHGYYLAVVVAVLGALVILIGLAQQAIAARDAQTWRAMAEWQVHAARRRIAGESHQDDVDPASTEYYELLIGTLVRQAAEGPEEPRSATGDAGWTGRRRT